MENVPQKIYLNLGDDADDVKDFTELSEVSWSRNKIHENDIEYVLADGWVKIKDELPPPLTVILGYSKAWIDEDYEPEGIRETFMDEDGNFLSAKWNNSMDCWNTDDKTKPTHWMRRPSPPKQ